MLGVVLNFITQPLRGDTLSMYGDGSQTLETFCYRDDPDSGLDSVGPELLKAKKRHASARGIRIEFNMLRTCRVFGFQSLHKGLKSASRSSPSTMMIQKQKAIPILCVPSPSFNKPPTVSLEEKSRIGTVHWFRQQLQSDLEHKR